MKIRQFQESDLEELKRIHKQYEHEFHFDELFSPHATDRFTITDDNDKIVLYGTNALILETFAITNKELSVKDRRAALLMLLQACMFSAGRNNFDQLHCFIQDDTWAKQLRKYGFRDTKGKSLVLNI
jgi:hypothetical protein